MAMNGTETRQEIQAKIDSAGLKWTAGNTPHHQMTDDEFRNRLGYPGLFPQSVLQQAEQEALRRYQEWRTQQTSSTLPTRWDWRDINGRSFISPVKNQGGCNSCVAFGTGAAMDARMRITLGVAVNDPHGDVLDDVSEGNILCGAGANVCKVGWWISNALEFCESSGVVPASRFPYDPSHPKCGLYPGWQEQVTQIGGSAPLSGMEDMRQRLSSSGPLIAKMKIFKDFQAYKGGIYHPIPGAIPIDLHVLCVIGYDDTKSAWLCKNSWGTNWGENGYCWIAYGASGLGSEVWSITSFKKIYTRLTGQPVRAPLESSKLPLRRSA